MKLRGHEKFPLREGWISKGIKGVLINNRIFNSTDGPDILGVGTNMVKSIRFWMQSFGLIEDVPKGGVKLSDLGNIVNQKDLYLENDFTLWLLHSNIAKNEERTTTWYLFFNKCQADEFRKEELFDFLRKELIGLTGNDKFSDNSLRDDIDVLLNMYSKNITDDDPEDKNRSPFASLGLLKKEDDIYYRQQPSLKKINSKIVLYELSIMFQTENSVSIDTIYNLMSSIYFLNKVTLNNYLDDLDNSGYIKVDRTAGLDIVYPINMALPNKIINDNI